MTRMFTYLCAKGEAEFLAEVGFVICAPDFLKPADEALLLLRSMPLSIVCEP